MSLQNELLELTADQPVQPADRLTAVTGRVRRIRQRRAAGGVLAVVAAAAVAVPLTVGSDGTPSGADYAGTPATSWPSRSHDGYVGDPATVLVAWDSGAYDFRSLYRGQMLHEGSAYTATAFLARDSSGVRKLVTGTILGTELGPAGIPLEGFHWAFQETVVGDEAPSRVTITLSGDRGTDVISLEAPSARRLTWQVDELPGARASVAEVPTDAPSGTSSSRQGVFRFHMGKRLGPVSFAVDGTPMDQPLADDLPIVHPTYPQTAEGLASGSSGQLDPQEDGSFTATVYPSGNPASSGKADRMSIAMHCFGGGTMQLRLVKGGDPATVYATGTATCDGSSMDPVLQATGLPAKPDALLELTSDRLQVFAFVQH